MMSTFIIIVYNSTKKRRKHFLHMNNKKKLMSENHIPPFSLSSSQINPSYCFRHFWHILILDAAIKLIMSVGITSICSCTEPATARSLCEREKLINYYFYKSMISTCMPCYNTIKSNFYSFRFLYSTSIKKKEFKNYLSYNKLRL